MTTYLPNLRGLLDSRKWTEGGGNGRKTRKEEFEHKEVLK